MRQLIAVFILGIIICAALSWGAEIHDAAGAGNLELVKKLVRANPESVKLTNGRNSTPLHYACEKDHTALAEYLIEQGADIKAADIDGDTPLHCAALANSVRLITVLLTRGVDIDARNVQERTPLHYAAYQRSIDAVRVLIENGADINAADYEGHTALHAAAYSGPRALILMLLQNKADTEVKNNYGRTPLHIVARENGSAEMAGILIAHGADLNARDNSGDTPLSLAVWRGFNGIVDVLLDHDVFIPEVRDIPSEIVDDVAKRGLNRLFAILVERGMDLSIRNDNGGSLLHSASSGGSTAITELLINRGLDINERDRYGWTPLHYAAENGRREAAELLLAAGASVDEKSLAGYTPFNVAASNDRFELTRLLRAAGAGNSPVAFQLLQGSYFGQAPPADEPLLFAIDIVASNRFEHGTVTFAPDGTEAFWSSSYPVSDSGYSRGRILHSKVENGRWLPPQMAPFSLKDGSDDVPYFSPDGRKVFFISRRPAFPGEQNGSERIWYVSRIADGWSEPVLIEGGPNAKGTHWQFSVAANGNIYFGSDDAGGFGMGDIYVSRCVNGIYTPADNLGQVINSESEEGSPYIAPDESYLMFTTFGRPDNTGGADIFISFKTANGNWTPPQNIGAAVNTPSNEICPAVTSDGRYFFFNSFKSGNADNYWLKAAFINKLRPT